MYDSLAQRPARRRRARGDDAVGPSAQEEDAEKETGSSERTKPAARSADAAAEERGPPRAEPTPGGCGTAPGGMEVRSPCRRGWRPARSGRPARRRPGNLRCGALNRCPWAMVQAASGAPRGLDLAEYRSGAEAGCRYECAPTLPAHGAHGAPAAARFILRLCGAVADLDHTADIQLHACERLNSHTRPLSGLSSSRAPLLHTSREPQSARLGGESLEEAFANVALAMFNYMTVRAWAPCPPAGLCRGVCCSAGPAFAPSSAGP